LIVAGGTGGHIFPAVALANELVNLGADVVLVGRDNSLEQVVASRCQFPFEPIKAGQIVGKGLLLKLKGLIAILQGFFRALALIDRLKPAVVVAGGGFVSAPVVLACLIKRKKFFLLEQNVIPGRVTRYFAPYAQEIFLTFPLAIKLRGNFSITGTPLREGIIRQVEKHYQEPAQQTAVPTVLVLGGSQGSRALNLAALDLGATLSNVRVIIVTGKRDYEMIKSRVCSSNCQVIEWSEHPEELYSQATLCITRAGAQVLSELLASGVPMIIVPFPYAADKHQDANARYLAELGAGVVLEQSQLAGLVSLVQSLIKDPERLNLMQTRARSAARLDAGRVIAKKVIAMSEGN